MLDFFPVPFFDSEAGMVDQDEPGFVQ